ncbi:MAG: hypothetical protein K1X81_07805 [Bacteroidia bacterium]|nr:hypothetical protein [Bacteroidia bacterium]
MHKLLKSTLFTVLFILVFIQKNWAQTFEVTDSNEFDLTFDVMVDSCLANLNVDSIPTGLLLEKAFQTADPGYFTGFLTDSNVADHFTWRCLYGTMRRAFMDTTLAFDSLGIAMDTIQHHYLDSGIIPISVLNYQYATIKENALEEGMLYFNGIQLYDDTGRTESPYETHTCFVAATGVADPGSDEVIFALPAYLYTSNDTRTVDYIEIDFADGEGWQNGHWGDIFSVDYNTTDTDYVIKLRLHFTNTCAFLSL